MQMMEFYQRSHLSQKMRNLKAYSIENTVITKNVKNRQKKTEKLKRQKKRRKASWQSFRGRGE